MTSIQHTTAFRHPQRAQTIVSLVVHTTGDTDLAAVLHYYKHSSRGVAPHYLIALDGTVHVLVPEDEIAYHAGYGNQKVLYQQGWEVWSRRSPTDSLPWPGYIWWRERWPSLNSPLDLPAGAAPNGSTVGVELLSSKRRLPEVVTEAQYVAVAELAQDVAARYNFPMDAQHVIGHEDLNPIARCDKRGGWDPGISRGFRWDRVLGEPAPAGESEQ